MRKLSVKVELVQAMDALIGGVVQDRPPTGTLIFGYLICLRGTATAAVAVDPIVDLGQWILRSSAGSSLVSEQNFGFLTERTRRMFGSIGWVNDPAAAADPIFLQWLHCFDLAGGNHGNVYPVAQGDSIEMVLPAVLAAVVEAGTVWEVHRVAVDRGDAYYLPRYHGRALDLAELRYDLAGKTAMIQLQPASVTDPDRVSLFDANGTRLMFLPWADALGFTNIMGQYDANEAEEVVYVHFSDEKESVIKCFGNDIFNLEIIDGAGTMQMSHCVVEPLPEGARALCASASSMTRMSQASRVARVGGGQATGAATALASAAVAPGAASATSVTGSVQSEAAAIPTLRSTAAAVPRTNNTPAGVISSWKR